jgi:hypothetical protein
MCEWCCIYVNDEMIMDELVDMLMLYFNGFIVS